MDKTRTTWNIEQEYPYPRNTLTVTQIRETFLNEPAPLKSVQRNINLYKKRLKELEQKTKRHIQEILQTKKQNEIDIWLSLEKIKHNETEKNIKQHIRRLERLLPINEKKGLFMSEEVVLKAKEYPIQELVTSYGIKIQHKKCICPFHNEKTPSMSFKNNRFHCFGCDKSGDTIDFVMAVENVSFIEAVKKLQ